MTRNFISICIALALLSACGKPAPNGVKVGKPYEVDGQTYYPEYDSSYDKTGMASWYGPGFHSKQTANGETYDQEDLTAAHPTLPMPSLVRVTNLESGKSLIVRVNDRGPFKKNRIIDLSKRSAEMLGIRSTARVRVQFLQKETEEYLVKMQVDGRLPDMFAINEPKSAPAPESTQVAEAKTDSSSSSSSGFSFISKAFADNEPEQKPAEPIAAAPEAVPTAKGGEVELSNAENEGRVDVPAPGSISSNDAPEAALQPPAKTVSAAKPEEKTAPKFSAKAAAAASPSAGGFLIQAGAFSTEAKAEALAKKLKKAGESMIDTVESNGRTLWRLRIGPFGSKAQAENALEKVHSLGAPDAKMVK